MTRLQRTIYLAMFAAFVGLLTGMHLLLSDNEQRYIPLPPEQVVSLDEAVAKVCNVDSQGFMLHFYRADDPVSQAQERTLSSLNRMQGGRGVILSIDIGRLPAALAATTTPHLVAVPLSWDKAHAKLVQLSSYSTAEYPLEYKAVKDFFFVGLWNARHEAPSKYDCREAVELVWPK
jgi:hypothetical protein